MNTTREFAAELWDDYIDMPKPLLAAIYVALASDFSVKREYQSPDLFTIFAEMCEGCTTTKKSGGPNTWEINWEKIDKAVERVKNERQSIVNNFKFTMENSGKRTGTTEFNIAILPEYPIQLHPDSGAIVGHELEHLMNINALANHWWGKLAEKNTQSEEARRVMNAAIDMMEPGRQ